MVGIIQSCFESFELVYASSCKLVYLSVFTAAIIMFLDPFNFFILMRSQWIASALGDGAKKY